MQTVKFRGSDRAIAMSVCVIRAFIEQREKLAANAAILSDWPRSIKHSSSMTPHFETFTKNFCRCSHRRQNRRGDKSDSPRHRKPRL
jgi:hypothetical protein